MSPRQALASALHLFVILAFLIGAFFFVALPYLPHLREPLYEKSTLIGLSLFLASLILLIGFYAFNRGRYLVIRMGVATDVQVIRQTVEDCFLRRFPKKIALQELELGRKSRLEFRVSMAPLEEATREELFVEAEKHLSTLLRERFGYSKPFYLIVKS